MQQITEIKHSLNGRVQEFPCQVVRLLPDELVVLFRSTRPYSVHGVDLPVGTITFGYFWPDRPFNIYHWMGPDGATRGYYFNVGRVLRLEPSVVEWDDLAVDVLATPDGQVHVLDEDEVPADIDPTERAFIFAARDRVLQELPALTAEAETTSAALAAARAEG